MAFKKYTLAVAVMAIMSGSAMAENLNAGHIQFNGLVNPNTCTVKMLADSVTQNQEDFKVALKTVDITDFTGASNNDVASVLGETNFTMDVTCPGTVTPDETKISAYSSIRLTAQLPTLAACCSRKKILKAQPITLHWC